VTSLHTIEQTVFGLPDFATEPAVEGRPVVGMLDVFKQKLPFPAGTNLPQQSLVLNEAAASRAVLHAGSSLLSTAGFGEAAMSSPDTAFHFGIRQALEHVALDWLQLMDPAQATAAVQALLSTQPVANPPYPPIEAAVLGSILPEDIAYTVSSLTTANQAVFFGTDDGYACTFAIRFGTSLNRSRANVGSAG
jgi:hypothetical protein